ncbi:Protein of unknown function (Gmx_para_CXXCG) [Bacillus sp. OV166]|uniref:double-CXXCG motif protein n=1 Tax=Bacillus sp. OV166 TaxID=1882763 RepID=UPI000A2AD9A4|nr:double-CXXCG motif protein [Bacillus sp. OV166]SMQ80970.1 Protein of unknown function (Gmx_para_CXXCG) [Bacillus sp. OV166]
MFYNLGSPVYSSDVAMSRANPVEYINPVFLPGIYCPKCNDLWASSSRVRINETVSKQVSNILQSHNLPDFGVPLDQFQSLCKEIALATNIPLKMLEPGVDLCPPEGLIRNTKVKDFTHPFPGLIWVKESVKASLEEAKLQGITFIKVNLKWTGKMKNSTEAVPELWEIVVNGKAWLEGSNLETITACSMCGRKEFLRGKNSKVDKTRWEGSDAFYVDDNPNIVIVTEKVKEILDYGKFTNFDCKAI